MEETSLCVQGLVESNDILQEQNQRLRNVNRILRIVNSALREQLRRAHASDEEFKMFCQAQIVTDIT
jgi:hypothetical protein